MNYEEEQKRSEIENVESTGPPNHAEKEQPFDRLMFGNKSKSKPKPSEEVKPSTDTGQSNQINLEEIMGHIDTLMNSAQELKPMFRNIGPFIGKFLKK